MQVEDTGRQILLQDRRSGGGHVGDAAATGLGLWSRSLTIGKLGRTYASGAGSVGLSTEFEMKPDVPVCEQHRAFARDGDSRGAPRPSSSVPLRGCLAWGSS